MPLRKADGPLMVQLPSPAQDRPSWLGVGVVAAVGFVVGVAWPRLAGVRLGPSVPDSPAASASEGEPPAALASAPAARSSVPVALPAPVAPSSLSSSTAAGAAAGGPASAGGVRVSVAHGAVFSCKSASGDSLKGADCGALPGLDAVVLPRLRKLGDCPDASAAGARVRLVVRADFARDALAVDLGRDRAAPGAAPLLACARSALASASLDGIAHDNPRYSVSYAVTLGAPSGTDASPAAAPTSAAAPTPAPASGAAAADGTAQIEWDVAIVRDAPKTGKIVARLQRGTSVRLGAVKDGWYPIKYGDGFAGDGWIYRGAIGR